jgi:hypothetical protein
MHVTAIHFNSPRLWNEQHDSEVKKCNDQSRPQEEALQAATGNVKISFILIPFPSFG